jgi:hypothetical protein
LKRLRADLRIIAAQIEAQVKPTRRHK